MEKYEMEEYLKEQLGVEEAYTEIINALSTDQLEDIFYYICRNHDIEPEEETEEEEEEEQEEPQEINVVVIENNNGLLMITKRTIKDQLEEFYKICNCDLIDIQERKINNKYYNFIFDEEFLCKEKPIPTLFEKTGHEILCGTIIICPINEEHTEILGSFTPEEQHKIFMKLTESPIYEF